MLLHIEGVDENYLNTVGLELISGRDFRGMQDSGKIIINQISCKRYFGDNPEGTILEGLNGAEIIGVIKDFKFQTFDNEVEPIGLWYRPNMLNLCNIRFSGQEFSDALDHIEKTWNTFCNEYPYQCNFVDRLYEGRYNNQKRIAELLMFFSLISVFIASLGIFGLATFTVEKRSKEVGVRKVNGASVPEIIKLFAGDVNRIVLWSALPSFVTTYFIMNRWLDTFAYHVIMPWTLYVLSAIIVWLVAILSTAGKSLRTARINPTEVLRTE